VPAYITIWEEIRDRIKPRVDELVRDIAQNIPGDESLIRFQNAPRELEEILEHRADEWIVRVYGKCRDARHELKKRETQNFRRAVWTFEIQPFIDERLSDLLLRGAGLEETEVQIVKAGKLEAIMWSQRWERLTPKVSVCERVKERLRLRWMQKLFAPPALPVEVTPKEPPINKGKLKQSDQQEILQLENRTKPRQGKLERDTELPVERGQKQQDLSKYLDGAQLTERQRECQSLRFEYGLSVADIAKRLGVNRTTVAEHLVAANRKLEKADARNRSAKNRAKVNPNQFN